MPVTEKQIAVVKYFLTMSKDMNLQAKKLAMFLIEKSKGFTQDVFVTLTESPNGLHKDEVFSAGAAFHDIQSCGYSTHLWAIMVGMDMPMEFSSHIGTLFENGEIKHLPNNIASHTFWLSRKRYSREAKKLKISRKQLNAIPFGWHKDIMDLSNVILEK